MHKRLRTVQIVKKRTDTLRTLLRRSASEYQTLKAAVKLREARIRVLSAQIGETLLMLRTPEQVRRIARLETEIEALRATSPSALIVEIQAALDAGE